MDWKDYCDLINIAERTKLVTQHNIPESGPVDFMIMVSKNNTRKAYMNGLLTLSLIAQEHYRPRSLD